MLLPKLRFSTKYTRSEKYKLKRALDGNLLQKCHKNMKNILLFKLAP